MIRMTPGEKLTPSPEEISAGDVIRCKGRGAVVVQAPGIAVDGSFGLEVTTDPDGSVVATCDPGPRPNA